MESVKTAEVRGNAPGNYIAMNTKGELYSTVSQTGDCLKFYVLQYSISYTKRTPNQGHVSFFQTIKPQPSWGTVTIRSSCTFTSQEYARFLVKVATESLILIKRATSSGSVNQRILFVLTCQWTPKMIENILCLQVFSLNVLKFYFYLLNRAFSEL